MIIPEITSITLASNNVVRKLSQPFSNIDIVKSFSSDDLRQFDNEIFETRIPVHDCAAHAEDFWLFMANRYFGVFYDSVAEAVNKCAQNVYGNGEITNMRLLRRSFVSKSVRFVFSPTSAHPVALVSRKPRK